VSLDYPILPICQTAESFRNILSEMGPYRDSISLKKKSLIGSLYRLGGSIRFGYCVIPCFGGLCEERLPCFYSPEFGNVLFQIVVFLVGAIQIL